MAWLYLFLAGLFEIGFTTFLKLSDGFGRLWPTAFFLLFALASFWLLNKSLQGVPLGTAYAVWTGIGAFGTAIVGRTSLRAGHLMPDHLSWPAVTLWWYR